MTPIARHPWWRGARGESRGRGRDQADSPDGGDDRRAQATTSLQFSPRSRRTVHGAVRSVDAVFKLRGLQQLWRNVHVRRPPFASSRIARRRRYAISPEGNLLADAGLHRITIVRLRSVIGTTAHMSRQTAARLSSGKVIRRLKR